MSLRSRQKAWLRLYDIGVLGLLALVAGKLAFTIGFKGVEAFHMSVAADGGWRVFNGQVPYRDFHVIMGPAVFYLQALFFWATGGFSWSGLLLHVAVVNAAVIVATYYVSRRWHGRALSTLFAGLAAVSFYLPYSYPEYHYTAMFFFLLGLLALEYLATGGGRWRTRMLAAGAGVCGALSILSKQNVGFLAVATLAAIIVADRLSRRQRALETLWPFAAGVALTLGIPGALYEWHGHFLRDVVGQGQAARLRRFADPWTFLEGVTSPYYLPGLLSAGLLVVMVCGAAWMAIRRRDELADTLPLVTRIVLLSGAHVLARQTGSGHIVMDQALLGVLIAYVAAFAERMLYGPDGFRVRRFTRLCALAGAVCAVVVLVGVFHHSDTSSGREVFGRYSLRYAAMLGLGIVSTAILLGGRYAAARWLRSESRAWLSGVAIVTLALTAMYGKYSWDREALAGFGHPEFRHVTYSMRAPALAGLKAREEIGREIDEVIEFVDTRIPRGAQLFVFPSAQWLYGATGHESVRGALVIPHWGVSYRTPDFDTDAVIAADPQWVVLHRPAGAHWRPRVKTYTVDYHLVHMPQLATYLRERFEVAAELKGFTVLRKKPG